MHTPNSTFFVSEAVVRNLKQVASRHLHDVSSSHLSEGLAAALGFRSHASLRAALKDRPTVEVLKPSNARLVQRLRQFGYSTLTEELRALPELDRSYTPYRNFPLRKKRGVRWPAWRNLVVSAINAGLQQKLFGLAPDENWWPGAAPESHQSTSGIYRFSLDNGDPVVVHVDAMSGDELSFYIALNPRRGDIEPSMYSGLSECDAAAHCWLERRLGVWMQDSGSGEGFSCKRSAQALLAGLAVQPHGYSDLGSFIL